MTEATADQEGSAGLSRSSTLCSERRTLSLDPEGSLVVAMQADRCAQATAAAGGPSSYPVALGHSSDEGEEDYEGVAPHASDDEYSAVEEPGETEVVFVREGVNVWPTRSERIMGRLSLIKQHRVLFLAWLPYTPGSLLEDGSFHAATAEAAVQSMQSVKERTLYAVHPIPLSEVKAIHKHTPPLGSHKIVITLGSGVSLAPLYFQQGGVKAFFSALREHARLLRSADDPNTYLVNDTADPLQRSLTSMELTDVLMGAPPAGASSTFAPSSGPLAQKGWQATEGEVPIRAQVADLVERFQRSLYGAKAAASSFFANAVIPQFSDILNDEEEEGGQRQAQQAQQQEEAEEAEEAAAKQGPIRGWPKKDSQPGRSRGPPVPGVPGADLAAAFSSGSSSSELVEGQQGATTAEGAGLPPSPFGSSIFVSSGSTSSSGGGQVGRGLEEEKPREREVATTRLGVFEIIERSNAGDASTQLWTRARPPPLSLEELNTFCDAEGRLVDEAAFRQRVFYGGLEHEARPLGWKLLLGVFPPGFTREERKGREEALLQRYTRLRGQWRSISRDQAARFGKWRERRSRIEKDVRRTDRGVRLFAKERGQGQELLRGLLLSYSLWNFDLGYVQGMSDLAAPMLHVIRSQIGDTQLSQEECLSVESQAFWCFERLMNRMEGNFSSDCTGMHAQLVALRRLVQLLDPPLYAHLEAADCLNFYYCYRWCLLHFKRELGFEEVLRLWEALWSCPSTPQLHLYMCVAVLEHHRRNILSDMNLDFDGMLKLCVELAGKLDLGALLRDAELLVGYAGAAGAECVAGLPVLPLHERAAEAAAAAAGLGAGAAAGTEQGQGQGEAAAAGKGEGAQQEAGGGEGGEETATR